MDEDGLTVVGCPSCSQRFRVRQQSAGGAVKCPHCGEAVGVPTSATEDQAKFAPPSPLGMAPIAAQPTPASVTPSQPPLQPAQQREPQFDPQPAGGTAAALNPFQTPTLDIAPAGVSGLPIKRHYPALQIIRTFYLVIACLVVIGWVIFMAVTLVFAAKAGAVGAWLVASLIPTAGAAIGATMLVAVSEGIKLAIDIQSNTLATARATIGRSK